MKYNTSFRKYQALQKKFKKKLRHFRRNFFVSLIGPPSSLSVKTEKKRNQHFFKETLIKALPRQGEREKNMEFQYVKPKALMLIWDKSVFP